MFVDTADRNKTIREIETLIKDYGKGQMDSANRALITSVMLAACDGSMKKMQKEMCKAMLLQGENPHVKVSEDFVKDFMNMLRLALGVTYSDVMQSIIASIRTTDEAPEDLPFV